MPTVAEALLGKEPLGGPQYQSSGPQWLRMLGDAAQRLSGKIAPSNYISASDAASMLPGGGLVSAVEPYSQGLQKTAAATQAFREGRWKDAAMNYGAGMLDTANAGLQAIPEVGALAKLAALPFLAKTNDGRINLGAVMRDVDRGGLNSLDRADMRRMNQAVDAQDWSEAEVPIRSLYATQPYANADFAEAAAKRVGDGLDLPLVVRAPDGKMYVRDGHHRLTAVADTDAQMAKVRLVDLLNQEELPQLPFGK